jgi:acetolactate synthase I/II/III large subunit
VKLAEAYGGEGERVQKADELRPALQRALEAVTKRRTFLLDVIIKP